MQALEDLLAPIRRSPLLPEALEHLRGILAAEQQRRQTFYAEITPEQKREFILGEVVLHSPACYSHLSVTTNIVVLLHAYIQRHDLGVVLTEKCLCMFPRNDYEPDIAYFGPAKSAHFQSGTMKFPPPDLAVEVLSESTESRDRGIKFEDYAANGVGEYWIVDADAAVVEQYVLRAGDFDLQMKSATGLLSSSVITGFAVEVAALFDRDQHSRALAFLVK